MNQPNKRIRDADVNGMPHKLQISLNNFCQDDVECTASIPNPNPVSTGLRLSYDDDEHNSSISSGGGNISSLPIIMCLDDNLRTEFDRQKEEFDNYIKIQVLAFTSDFFSLVLTYSFLFVCQKYFLWYEQ